MLRASTLAQSGTPVLVLLIWRGRTEGSWEGTVCTNEQGPSPPSVTAWQRSVSTDGVQTGQQKRVTWIMCDECEQWFHVGCVGLTAKTADVGSAQYVCSSSTVSFLVNTNLGINIISLFTYISIFVSCICKISAVFHYTFSDCIQLTCNNILTTENHWEPLRTNGNYREPLVTTWKDRVLVVPTESLTNRV